MAFFNKKALVTAVAAASIFLAVAVNGALSENQQATPPPSIDIQYPSVSIEQVEFISETTKISAYGEVKPRNELALTSQISGKVVYLSPKLLSGAQFKQGELLIEIEDVEFQQALANAKASLAEAKLSLAQEKVNNDLAIAEQRRSGNNTKQASKLQLEVAQAKYDFAQKNLDKAKYDLAQTKIYAPFNSLLVSRDVQIGSIVQQGTALVTLYDDSIFEVKLPLSEQQWQLIPSTSTNFGVTLTNEASSTRWQADIDRVELHLDQASRQRSLIASVRMPLSQQNPLYPGTFVKAEITGETQKQVWKLPASALISDSTVWQVNDDNLLKKLPVEHVFSKDSFVYVRPSHSVLSGKIVKRPLASYLENMKVTPLVESLPTDTMVSLSNSATSPTEENL